MPIETVFVVPRLREASVIAGACCPVPVEAVLIPELEALVGVDEALADWQSGRVTVRHAASFEPAQAAAVLADFDYPATEWNTLASPGVATLD